MTNPTIRRVRLTPISTAVSLALASLVTANAALAQEAQTPTPDGTNKDAGQIATVTVVATRASQQSSIDRKKNAATAIDSIVAADVGALPDRNIGEAISRMSGIALDRGDFGEGVSVAVRGNGPDLTRVEVDGQAVQSAGGTDMAGGGNGRGTEFRQLSSDLIKSVDVVKGSTADMDEGSLGGGIIIKTRTGLDFKKPFVSVRVAGQQSSLANKWEPDANIVLANKYLDGRLGVLLNASTSTQSNEGHRMEVATSGTAGYARSLDFDNSPNKTFTYNPSTLNLADPTSTTPTASYPFATGTGAWNAATPQQILTQSAAAQTKADCYAAFPVLTTSSAQLANLSSSNRTNAVNVRQNELTSCLNQWNDYTPSLIRDVVKREVDKRQDLDLRFDFKVNNDLTVYAKGSYNKRKVDDNNLTYSLGGLNVNTTGTYTDKNGVRTPVAGSGYFLYPNNPSYVSGVPTTGSVANVDPSSVVVDASHHVTQYSITDGTATTDQIHAQAETTAKYLQLGGEYRHGPVSLEFFVGDAKSDFERSDARTAFSYGYGAATLSVLPNGLWSYNIPASANFNQSNPANYVYLLQPAASAKATASTSTINSIPAYTAAQQPLLTQAPGLSWTPQIRDSEERTAKLDLSYALPDEIPFFKRIKTGFNLRDTLGDTWTGAGYTVQTGQGTPGTSSWVAPIIVPSASLRSSFVGCQDTPGSLGTGGNKCQYGVVPSNSYSTALTSQVVMTPAQFQDIVTQSLTGNATATSFFNGAKGLPSGLLSNWTQINVDKVFSMAGVPYANFDCVKQCTANDGKVYDQPVNHYRERTQAAYFMTDFGLDHIPFTDRPLPFNWELDGNMGVRYVRTHVGGTGLMTFQSITETASYDPANPNAAGGTVTTSVGQNTAINATTSDILPSYNLALWVVPDQVVLRYNRAKTVARPPVTDLLPAGTCIYDQRLGSSSANDVDQRCSNTIGNPALQAQKNINQNWSAEYYPNKDTMFSLAYFKQRGIVGPAITQGVNGQQLFAGTNTVDPTSGAALSDMRFDYNTYLNGAATTRKGWEFGTKTAFTFLPWLFRYTGFDGNYTKLASVTSSQNVVDLLTGNPLPPARESNWSYNWSLWYDDGKWQARVAVQSVSSYFNYIAANGANTVNNYPNAAGGRTTVIPYNPGSPDFKDATRFIDAKLSYKWKPNIEFFIEGRNLGNATTSESQGSYVPFSNGTPSLLDYNYAGRRIMIGVNFRN